VRDQHHRAAVVHEVVLEEEHRVRVQMVRRFVEQQQIRFGEECARQRHPLRLPTAQAVDVALRVAYAQPRQHRLHPAGPVPAAQPVDRRPDFTVPRDQPVVVRTRLTQTQTQPLVLGQRRHERRPPCRHRVADAVPRLERGLLRQMAHARPASQRDVAAVRALLACDDPEQRGLARAVHADEPDVLRLVDRERDAVEDHAPAVALTQVADVEDVHGRSIVSRARDGAAAARCRFRVGRRA
jgi:hypothetical protein